MCEEALGARNRSASVPPTLPFRKKKKLNMGDRTKKIVRSPEVLTPGITDPNDLLYLLHICLEQNQGIDSSRPLLTF